MSFLFKGIKNLLGYSENDIKDFKMEATFFRVNNSTENKICEFISCEVKFDISIPFQSKLWIINLSPNDDSNDEYQLPISKKMNMRFYKEEKNFCFEWNLDKNHNLIIEIDNKQQSELFDKYLSKLIFENENQREICESDSINEIIKKGKPIKKNTSPIKKEVSKKSSKYSLSNLNKEFKTLSIKEELKGEPSENLNQLLLQLTKDDKVIVANSGAYFELDSSQQPKIVDPHVIILIKQIEKFQYSFQLINLHQDIFYTKQISSELTFTVDQDQNVFKWLEGGLQLKIKGICFDNPGISVNYNFVISKCLFETNRQEDLDQALKDGDQQNMNGYFQQDVEYDEKEIQMHQNDDQMEFESEDEPEHENNQNEDGIHNIQQAKMLDRVFVTKGSKVSVFKPNTEYFYLCSNYYAKICDLPIIKSFDGQEIKPKKIQFQEQDTKLIFLNDKNDTKIYQMDLETGKIVQEIQADGFNTLTEISHEKKLDEFSTNQLILGMNNKNIFKLDPRVNTQNKAVEQKIYSGNNQFTCLESNAQGQFVIGNQKGDIRFYKEVGKNAKNLFPGWGEPIRHIDVTQNGKWVLATCKNYLIFLPTVHNSLDCFTTTVKDKPVPRKLTLLPEHMMQLGISELDFLSAKFDQAEGKEEKQIVASTGNYLITWSIRNILKGRIYDYNIKCLNENIVGSDFKYNQINKVVVASQKELLIKQLKKK